MKGRPKNEEELQKREALGVIRASRFIRKFSHSNQEISLETLCRIHHEIFLDAWREIAGVYRKENLSITDSPLVLPPFQEVPFLMEKLSVSLREQLRLLQTVPGTLMMPESEESIFDEIDKVVHTAAWLHHEITIIHPFRDGNGRTARLAANLILERYGLVGISIKVEKENKNRYRQALRQADTMQDFEPLKELIYEGLTERYEGVAMKYYSLK